jgi:PPOX class probable F420-dependent enzyme
MHPFDELRRARYASLRTYRRDGTPVDTPIWFTMDGATLVFRTKIGPKTNRLTHDPRAELRACDHRGRLTGTETTFRGHATILSGTEAASANDSLRRRYGWQYNLVPLVKIPGVTNVDSALPLREKLRRVRDRGVWDGSALVRVDL